MVTEPWEDTTSPKGVQGPVLRDPLFTEDEYTWESPREKRKKMKQNYGE